MIQDHQPFGLGELDLQVRQLLGKVLELLRGVFRRRGLLEIRQGLKNDGRGL